MKNISPMNIICCTILLSSCAHKNDVVLVDNISLSTSFIKQGNSNLDTRWWYSFNDPMLVKLITEGLDKNLTLKARALRLKSSAIDTQISAADYYPNLNLTANASSDLDDYTDVNSASLGINSSWELDIWGRISANKNKSYWVNKGQQALYRAQANLVAGTIATAWLGLVSEQEKKLTLTAQYQRTQDALTVISRRFAMGKNSVTDIWQQQRLLKSIEVQQSTNLTTIYLYKQTLALWLGIPASKLTYNNDSNLLKLPELPYIGIPAQVLKYRPDIEFAFAKIKSANENLSIAIAAQYPRITLQANYSTSKDTLADLFDDWSGNLIASLALPLLDSGTNKQIVKQRKLELKALILDYQQVWREAMASVNKVLINEDQLLKVSKNLTLQLDLAERTEKLTTIKYLNGKTNYLNLLRAQESILSLERQLIDANRRLVTNRVLLYRELSHGDFSSVKAFNHQHNKGKES